MRPNTAYRRPDGTLIQVTEPTAGIWSFILNESIGGFAAEPWTGLQSNWTTQTTGALCLGGPTWSSPSSSQLGTVGDANSPSADAISKSGSYPCDISHPFYCVEQ